MNSLTNWEETVLDTNNLHVLKCVEWLFKHSYQILKLLELFFSVHLLEMIQWEAES